MATNQMRREAAKRKLARQQERRVEQAKRRRQFTVIGSVIGVVAVVVAVVLLTTLPTVSAPANDAAGATTAPPAAGTCTYAAEGAAAKANQPPKEVASADAAALAAPKVALTTSAGPIGLTLEPAKAPCTVNSFVSLVAQKYFDATPCHRLTTGEGLKVLQCGDPSGQGSGGPGYTIPDENPTGLAAAASGSVVYPRGTVAMANTGQPNSGGSQFFLVYADSQLPPNYAVFGTIDEAGLATLDKVAKLGTADGSADGKPKTAVTIETATAA